MPRTGEIGDTSVTVDGPRMSFKWNSLEPESETPSQEGTVYLPFEAWQSVAIHPPSNVVAVAERTGVDPLFTPFPSSVPIHILGMNAREPAPKPHLNPLPHDLGFDVSYPPRISISKDVVAVLFDRNIEGATPRGTLVVWNWRKGQKLHFQENVPYHGITLINDTWLFAGYWRQENLHTSDAIPGEHDRAANMFPLYLLDTSVKSTHGESTQGKHIYVKVHDESDEKGLADLFCDLYSDETSHNGLNNSTFYHQSPPRKVLTALLGYRSEDGARKVRHQVDMSIPSLMEMVEKHPDAKEIVWGDLASCVLEPEDIDKRSSTYRSHRSRNL